ncbi:FAD:protein FMN transferase [Treponema sp.]
MISTKIRISILFTILALAFSSSSCAEPIPPQTEFIIGTVCNVNLFEKGSREAYKEIFARLREIEERMSANAEGTEVDAINQAAGIHPVSVHPDTLEVIRAARHYAEISGGAFDPTVGPLVKLWNIGSEDAAIPLQSELDQALHLIDWRNLVIDETAKTAFLKQRGMRLDLGAIAKGYAADEVARIIERHRIPRAIIDLGGNVLAYGSKQGNKPWRIGVQDPSGARGSYIGILEIINKTMVTSGVYERFFIEEGRRYHHILSTHDGYPVQNGLLSVTIVADRSIDADGLSTTVFALGYERGEALVESIPGLAAIYVFEDLSIKLSPGVKNSFKLTNPNFHLVK